MVVMVVMVVVVVMVMVVVVVVAGELGDNIFIIFAVTTGLHGRSSTVM